MITDKRKAINTDEIDLDNLRRVFLSSKEEEVQSDFNKAYRLTKGSVERAFQICLMTLNQYGVKVADSVHFKDNVEVKKFIDLFNRLVSHYRDNSPDKTPVFQVFTFDVAGNNYKFDTEHFNKIAAVIAKRYCGILEHSETLNANTPDTYFDRLILDLAMLTQYGIRSFEFENQDDFDEFADSLGDAIEMMNFNKMEIA